MESWDLLCIYRHESGTIREVVQRSMVLAAVSFCGTWHLGRTVLGCALAALFPQLLILGMTSQTHASTASAG